MPTWVWVLLSIWAALFLIAALALSLLRFRYFLEWRGAWTGALSGSSEGALRIETRFLWYKHVWEPLKDKSWSVADLFTDDDDEGKAETKSGDEKNEDAQDEGIKTEEIPKEDSQANAAKDLEVGRKSPLDPEPETGFSERAAEDAARRKPEEPVFLKSPGPASTKPSPRDEKKKTDPNRKRRALFRLLTDRDAWKLLGHYGLKTLRLVLRLLKPRIEAAVGHPDPALLGRVAGKWYAARPFLSSIIGGRTDLYFRFQDRDPSLWVRVQGRFSALSVVGFGVRLVVAFPFILFARRALHGWRRHQLTGWRAWVYRKLQTSG